MAYTQHLLCVGLCVCVYSCFFPNVGHQQPFEFITFDGKVLRFCYCELKAQIKYTKTAKTPKTVELFMQDQQRAAAEVENSTEAKIINESVIASM